MSAENMASQGNPACLAMLTSSPRLPLDNVAMVNFDLSLLKPDGESGQPSNLCQMRFKSARSASSTDPRKSCLSASSSSLARCISSTMRHLPWPRLISRQADPYPARHSSANVVQSTVAMPCSRPNRVSSLTTDVRQSTTVPKTSNTSATGSARPDVSPFDITVAYSISS